MRRAILMALRISIFATALTAAAEPITYQGRLSDGGAPYNGLCDLHLRLWTEPTGGLLVGDELTLAGVPVEDGYFSVELDFGDLILTAGDRWIEIMVRPQGGAWTTLSPRQPVRAVPRSTVADYGVRSIAVVAPVVQSFDPQFPENVTLALDQAFIQRVDTLETLVADQAALIASLQSQIGAMQAEINALTVDVADVQGRVATVEGVTDTMTLTTIDGYPSLLLEGVNLHLRNGMGNTNTDNGTGNLVLGYNELRDSGTNTRTGSHNVVLGREQNYSGSSGIISGFANDYFADYGSILGGKDNEVYGLASVVVGGYLNIAGNPSDPNDSFFSVVVSGYNNNAKGRGAAILTGQNNTTFGDFSAVVAGNGNTVFGVRSAIVSGFSNQNSGTDGAILGGGIQTLGTFGTNADGKAATIVGGYRNGATGTYAVTVGGYLNTSSNTYTVTSSGLQRDATATGEWVSSGYGDSDWP